MKKLILTVAVISSMFSLTACSEKKVEAKQPEVQAPVASPVQASGTDSMQDVKDAEHLMLATMKENANDSIEYFGETSLAKWFVHKNVKQHGEYKFVSLAKEYTVDNPSKGDLKGDKRLFGTDVDCQNNRYRSIFMILNRNNNIDYKITADSKWVLDLPADSLGRKFIDKVCSR